MNFITTPLSDLIVVEPQVFGDDRGYFFESYHQQKFVTGGISDEFVQDNQSQSVKGTIRGLHFQKPPHTQSKLVRVIQGEVYDVAVDLRPDSATFGQWFGVYLNAENKKMLYIPVGFAHGFCVTSDVAVFVYKCGSLYSQADEDGIRFDDPDLNIKWPVDKTDIKLSAKDQTLKSFEQVRKEVVW